MERNLGMVVGPQGPQGEPGPAGPQGPQGEPGKAPDLGGLSFGQDAEGKWGYIPPGADTVIPFKSGVGGSGLSFENAEVIEYGGFNNASTSSARSKKKVLNKDYKMLLAVVGNYFSPPANISFSGNGLNFEIASGYVRVSCCLFQSDNGFKEGEEIDYSYSLTSSSTSAKRVVEGLIGFN